MKGKAHLLIFAHHLSDVKLLTERDRLIDLATSAHHIKSLELDHEDGRRSVHSQLLLGFNHFITSAEVTGSKISVAAIVQSKSWEDVLAAFVTGGQVEVLNSSEAVERLFKRGSRREFEVQVKERLIIRYNGRAIAASHSDDNDHSANGDDDESNYQRTCFGSDLNIKRSN